MLGDGDMLDDADTIGETNGLLTDVTGVLGAGELIRAPIELNASIPDGDDTGFGDADGVNP